MVGVAKTYLGRSKFSQSTKKKIAACINRKAKKLGCDVSKKAKADVDWLEDELADSDVFKTTKELVNRSIKNPGLDLFKKEAVYDLFNGEDASNLNVENLEVAKICGSKSLPTDDKEEWDGSAAEGRMRKKAGGPDKDKINWSQYAKGFVYCDPDNKESFEGYKLPFADVIGGTLKATWGGVSAAMAAVHGSRGGVKGVDAKKAHNFLASYYKKFDKEPPKWE
jgi:hypothetical protein